MKNMIIVITMGGLGSRFVEAGYTVPKYQIEAKGKTLFYYSMVSLNGFKDKVKKYVFVVKKEDNAKEFIEKQCENLNLDNIAIVEIDKVTDGQATTVMLAKEHWGHDDEILIYNIDTYVEENKMNSSQIEGDGFIPCFKASGEHWSFVRLDENGNSVELAEKRRISDNCTLGAYYFKTTKLYEDLYNEFYIENTQDIKERYIAPLYNLLIQKSGIVKICDINSEYVHVLGTPKELDEFINS